MIMVVMIIVMNTVMKELDSFKFCFDSNSNNIMASYKNMSMMMMMMMMMMIIIIIITRL
jgi:hypothetical protein